MDFGLNQGEIEGGAHADGEAELEDQGEDGADGTPEQVKAEVHSLFASYGRDGGYICSASDHFFTTPVENLLAFAEAARLCRYA